MRRAVALVAVALAIAALLAAAAVAAPAAGVDDDDELEREELAAEQSAEQDARAAFELRVTGRSSPALMGPEEDAPRAEWGASVDMVTRGQPAARFAACAPAAEGGSADVQELRQRCVAVDEFTDRVDVDAWYSAKQELARPKVWTPGLSELNAAVLVEFGLDEDAATASFAIEFHCEQLKPGAAFLVALEAVDLQVAVHFMKRCPSAEQLAAPHPFVQLKLSSRELPSIEDGQVVEAGMRSALSVMVEISLVPPATAVSHGAVSVTSGGSALKAHLLGLVSAGVIRRDRPESAPVVLQCVAQRTEPVVLVTIELETPPFKSHVITFSARCNTTAARTKPVEPLSANGNALSLEEALRLPMAARLNLGRFDYNNADVMLRGAPRHSYNVSVTDLAPSRARELLERPSGGVVLQVLPPQQSVIEFSVWNLVRSLPLGYSSLAVSVSNPAVLAASVSLPPMWGYYYLAAEGGMINDAFKKLRVRLFCKDAGSSLVTVSVLLDDGSSTEFGFAKQCIKPQVHVARRSTTAGSIMGWLVAVLAVAGFASLFWATRDIVRSSKDLRFAEQARRQQQQQPQYYHPGGRMSLADSRRQD